MFFEDLGLQTGPPPLVRLGHPRLYAGFQGLCQQEPP